MVLHVLPLPRVLCHAAVPVLALVSAVRVQRAVRSDAGTPFADAAVVVEVVPVKVLVFLAVAVAVVVVDPAADVAGDVVVAVVVVEH